MPIRPNARVERLEAQVARREVELLVVERVVGDVHLAVEAQQRAVGVEDDGRVVIEPRRPPLEERADDHDAGLLRDLRERLGGRAGDRLGQVEVARGPRVWQKYCERNSSCRQTIFAPRRAASRTRSTRAQDSHRDRARRETGSGRC